jgi:hypothetical protein
MLVRKALAVGRPRVALDVPDMLDDVRDRQRPARVEVT